MRTVTQTMNAQLHSKRGSEPITIIGISWNGNEILYSDKEKGSAKPLILSVGDISDISKYSGSSAKYLDVTLSDTDGTLRGFLDNIDFFNCSCNVYQCFDSVSIDDKFLLFTGNLVAPINYDPLEKSLSFQIQTGSDKLSVGYMSQQFNYDGDIAGQDLCWPISFGSTRRQPTLALASATQGILNSQATIPDPSIGTRLEQAKNLLCPQTMVAQRETGTGSDILDPTWQPIQNSNNTVALYTPNPVCVEKRYAEICKIITSKVQQDGHVTETIDIHNGTSFPQNETINININSGIFTGSFSGNTFTITNRWHPNTESLTYSVREFPGESLTTKQVIGGVSDGLQPAYSTSTTANLNSQLPHCYACDTANESQLVYGFGGGSEDAWRYYTSLEAGTEFVAGPGALVTYGSTFGLVYIVSITPGTVDGVYAYKNDTEYNEDFLMEVPSSYYTVEEVDYGSFTATQIVLDRKLSSYDPAWRDDIYVNFTSDIGPNPVEIIEWLIDNYSDYSIDSDSFSDVESWMSNYPVNFSIQKPTDLWTVLDKIAYQTRCELVLKSNTVYIKYLSRTPTPVKTIDASIVQIGSLEFGATDISDLVTSHEIAWSAGAVGKTNNEDPINKFIIKHNVDTYGYRPESFEYDVLTDFQSAQKTATFWMIRKANVYKTIKAVCPLECILLEYGDCVLVDLEEFSQSAIKCIVKGVVFNAASNTVTLELETPVKNGSTEEYYWYWPAGRPALATFPMAGEDGGESETFIPPTGHILDGANFSVSSGDPHPSDIDDSYPTEIIYTAGLIERDKFNPVKIMAQYSQDAYIDGLKPKIPNLDAYRKIVGSKMDSPGINEPLENFPCTFIIHVDYVFLTKVSKNGASCTTTGDGVPCEGATYQFAHTFVNYSSALQFHTNTNAEIINLYADGGRFTIGNLLPSSISSIRILKPDETSNCTDTTLTSSYISEEIVKPYLIGQGTV